MTDVDSRTGPYALRAGRLFDGEHWLARPTLIIDGETIAAAGVAAPPSLPMIDLGDDVTLLPGLIDCHQHLCFNGSGSLEDQVADIDDDDLTERARQAARRALRGGVTTLRDLGDRRWVTLPLRNVDGLPKIIAAGPPITRLGGHCWYLGGACEGEADLRAAVRERVERGCDVVKVMATGGALTSGSYPMWEPQFSAEELRVIVEAAHGAGLPVASHCHGLAGIERSLDAGVDSIEHCTFINAELRAEVDDAVLERLAASPVAISATIGRLPGAAVPALVANNGEQIRQMLTRLHSLGATIVAGTDAGITAAKPHDVAPYALADLLAAGLDLTQGLRALTSVAASVCGVADRKGHLTGGHDADVLAVSGDLDADPAALTNVRNVWCRGRTVDGAASSRTG